MAWSWWTRRRRRRLTAHPPPPHWSDLLADNFTLFTRLTAEERERLLRKVQVFVPEKNWEGCNGLVITEEVQITIAAQACLLVLGIEDEIFDHVLSILVYPTAYIAPDQHITRAGVVIEGQSNRLGEAWYRGPVILSWDDVLAGGRQEASGSNLVLHEFAHQLDMRNGSAMDGTPPLPSVDLASRWPIVMEREFQQLRRDCRRRDWPLLDCYGTTNRAEFFAVATEVFFERPAALSSRHPDLYDVLREYYRQDPRRYLVSTPH